MISNDEDSVPARVALSQLRGDLKLEHGREERGGARAGVLLVGQGDNEIVTHVVDRLEVGDFINIDFRYNYSNFYG